MFNIRFLLLLLLFSCYTLVGQDTYIDNFDTVSYGNNDGTSNFEANWIETSDGNSPSTGRIRINSNQLRFRNLDDRRIERALNLSAASSITLSLDYNRTVGNETILVQLFNGTGYNTVATLSGSGTISYDLTASEISSSSAIRFRSGSGGWSGSETIFVDNVRFLVISDLPPTVTATGNQTYCPSGTIPIVETISITDPDDTTAFQVSIQISSGYVNGEDLLTLTGSHPTITTSWNATEGKLTLAGPTTLTAFEAAVAAVEYSSSAANPSGSRVFSISVGDANYLPNTGHYYEYISDVGITWTAARNAATLRTYYGLQGYLATLTSQAEADFSGSQATGVGWIGASDNTTEGDWQWVTGPEAGTSFWSGGVGGTELTFAFWNSGEPNNCCSGEDYAHITHPNVNPNGSWNDLSNTGSTNPASNFHPQGYVVEYGGTVGDPVVNVTATTSITIDNIGPTASDPLPVTVYCSSDVPVVDITVVTDETDNCTVNPSVTFVGDVGNGGSNPEIITRTYRITDGSGNTTDVAQTITVNEIGVTVHPTDLIILVGNNAVFSVNAYNADTYQWQVSTNGGASYSSISDGVEYAGTQTSMLTVNAVGIDNDNYRYRVFVSNSSSPCPQITSNFGVLRVKVGTIITNRRITYRVKKD